MMMMMTTTTTTTMMMILMTMRIVIIRADADSKSNHTNTSAVSLQGKRLCCNANCLVTDWTDEAVDLWLQVFVMPAPAH